MRSRRAGGHREALLDGDVVLPFAELYGIAQGWAAAFAGRGVVRGDRVGIFLPRSTDAVGSFFGAVMNDAVAVPINESLKPQQVTHVLSHSGAKIVVTSPDLRSRLAIADVSAAVVEAPHRVVGSDPEMNVIGGDLAVLFYTSGSTGLSKKGRGDAQ